MTSLILGLRPVSTLDSGQSPPCFCLASKSTASGQQQELDGTARLGRQWVNTGRDLIRRARGWVGNGGPAEPGAE